MENITKENLTLAESLELISRRHVTALLSGHAKSPFKGSGMQFKEFRPYEAGDDIRHMSWPVTARTGHATVKIYEEDRERDIVVLTDVSGSTLFSSRVRSRLDMFSQIMTVVGLAAVRGGDKFGSLFFTNKAFAFHPPSRSRDNVLRHATRLATQESKGQASDIRPALSFLQTSLKNRAMILILSDFNLPSFSKELLALSKRHELVLIHAYDEWEAGRNLPGGVVEAWDPETQRYWLLDTSSKKIQTTLEQSLASKMRSLREVATAGQGDYIALSQQHDYLKNLVHFFHSR